MLTNACTPDIVLNVGDTHRLFEKGEPKMMHGRTDNRRKHIGQMSEAEVAVTLQEVRQRTYTFAPHAMERMRDRRINEAQVLAMLGYGAVVEVNNNVPNEHRVLLRGKVAGQYICAVVSLTTNKVVTAYKNHLNDHHQTLDKSLYQWEVDLTKELRGK